MKERIIHPIPPYFDADSQILILGSFPSVKSREQMFYYGHPQNRFWKVLAAVFDEETPTDILLKKNLLTKHHVALWDVIASCEIVGSSDASIESVIPNDLSEILDKADIRAIFINGKTAEKYYKKYSGEFTDIKAVYLPSTSPANASWSTEHLIDYWKQNILR